MINQLDNNPNKINIKKNFKHSQGKFCRSVCSIYKAKLKIRGGRKYDLNSYCSICDVWIPNDRIIISPVNNYHRCPCCNMKVRTKRYSSLSTKEK